MTSGRTASLLCAILLLAAGRPGAAEKKHTVQMPGMAAATPAQNAAMARQYYIQGDADLEAGNFSGAVRYCGMALAKNPKYAAAYECRGMALGELGKYKEAIADLDAIPALDPAYPRTAAFLRGRAFILAELKRCPEALADLDRALALKPEADMSAAIWQQKAGCFVPARRYDEAFKAYDRALALAPKNINLWNLRAGLALQAGRLKQAIADYDKALEIDPQNPHLRQKRKVAGMFGLVKSKDGRFEAMIPPGWAPGDGRAKNIAIDYWGKAPDSSAKASFQVYYFTDSQLGGESIQEMTAKDLKSFQSSGLTCADGIQKLPLSFGSVMEFTYGSSGASRRSGLLGYFRTKSPAYVYMVGINNLPLADALMLANSLRAAGGDQADAAE